MTRSQDAHSKSPRPKLPREERPQNKHGEKTEDQINFEEHKDDYLKPRMSHGTVNPDDMPDK